MTTKPHSTTCSSDAVFLGLPIDEVILKLKAQNAEMERASARIERERKERGYSFSARLIQAVKRRLAFRSVATDDDDEFAKRKERAREAGQNVDWNVQPSSRISASTTADEQSFAEKLKKAVERKSGGLPTQKQHAERAERERARYQHKPRPHTKSD
jgi:hypothetical protein